MIKVPYLFMIITVTGMAASQIMLRLGLPQVGTLPSNLGGIFHFLTKALTQPWIIGSIISTTIAAVSWVIAVSQAEVSRIYPFLGLSFILVALASWLILNESMSLWRWSGIILISIGVFLVLGVK
jgi:drug/metabolite transporter (DMT)-like permease